MTPTELTQTMNDCKDIIELVLGDDIQYKTQRFYAVFNNRFTHTLGRCSNNSWRSKIELSQKYFTHPSTTDDDRYVVMIHELLHAVKGCKGHNNTFNEYSRMIEQATGLKGIAGTTTKTSTEYNVSVDKGFKWEASCDDCHTTYRRKRKFEADVDHGEYLNRYRCGKCGGLLVHEEII